MSEIEQIIQTSLTAIKQIIQTSLTEIEQIILTSLTEIEQIIQTSFCCVCVRAHSTLDGKIDSDFTMQVGILKQHTPKCKFIGRCF